MSNRLWCIDCDFKLTATEDVEVKKAKHSFFAIRAASDISPPYGGVLANSASGVGAKGTYGKEARWCSYHGKRRGRGDWRRGRLSG
ncbi:MAG: PmoA family protein [Planctomycetes bacterium]|nr:PmoA family protein [Planctomycetota bacterium]